MGQKEVPYDIPTFVLDFWRCTNKRVALFGIKHSKFPAVCFMDKRPLVYLFSRMWNRPKAAVERSGVSGRSPVFCSNLSLFYEVFGPLRNVAALCTAVARADFPVPTPLRQQSANAVLIVKKISTKTLFYSKKSRFSVFFSVFSPPFWPHGKRQICWNIFREMART